MSRIKVSDLEITKRGFPLLIYAEPRDVGYWSDKEQKLPLLHISTRLGTKVKTSQYGHDRRFLVTHCNRPLQHTNIFTGGSLDTNSYRLCPRCAKKQTHKVALAEYRQWREDRNRREQAEREQEEKEARKRRGELHERLNDFGSEFFEESPIEWLGQPGKAYGMRVQHKDHTYEIREVEEQS